MPDKTNPPSAPPQLPAELLDPRLPSRTAAHRWTTSPSEPFLVPRSGPLKPLRDWTGKAFEEVVRGALELNQLTIRAASKLTGLPYTRFTRRHLAGAPARPETLNRMAKGLKIPQDVLYVRNGMLPPGSEGDIDFQDAVVRLWRSTRRRKR